MKQLLIQSIPDIDGVYGGAEIVYVVNADRTLTRLNGIDLGGSDAKRGRTVRLAMEQAEVMTNTPVVPDP